jgi:hypothetical protein
VVVLAALLFSLIGPSLVAAPVGPEARKQKDVSPVKQEEAGCPKDTVQPPEGEEEAEEEKPLNEAERLRLLMVLGSIMILSGEDTPPPDNSPSLVVKWPDSVSASSVTDSPTGSPVIDGSTPEPASVTTALFGSALTGLFAWWRKRRKRRDSREEVNPS